MPVLVVFAPTACGKTSLALDLFGKDSNSSLAGKAELISADSMQVYKGMDIGTAKASFFERQQLPHHLIDLQTPDIPFSVGDFVRHSDQLCQEIYSRGRFPLVLGGTGFYIRNFLCGLPTTPQADPQLRLYLQQRLQQEGSGVLYQELQQRDLESSKRIHPNDHYRILRALEIVLSSGKPQSSFALSPKLREGFIFSIMILWRERKELYQRINQRVAQMMEEGLPQEVQNLMASGYKKESPGMQAIGYREFFSCDLENLSGDEKNQRIQESICRNSRRYAKRQYTFFKGIPNAQYFHADDRSTIQSHIEDFFTSFYRNL